MQMDALLRERISDLYEMGYILVIEEFSKKYNLNIEDLEKLTTQSLKNANEVERDG